MGSAGLHGRTRGTERRGRPRTWPEPCWPSTAASRMSSPEHVQLTLFKLPRPSQWRRDHNCSTPRTLPRKCLFLSTSQHERGKFSVSLTMDHYHLSKLAAALKTHTKNLERICTPVFIAALLTTAKRWEQWKCRSVPSGSTWVQPHKDMFFPDLKGALTPAAAGMCPRTRC